MECPLSSCWPVTSTTGWGRDCIQGDDDWWYDTVITWKVTLSRIGYSDIFEGNVILHWSHGCFNSEQAKHSLKIFNMTLFVGDLMWIRDPYLPWKRWLPTRCYWHVHVQSYMCCKRDSSWLTFRLSCHRFATENHRLNQQVFWTPGLLEFSHQLIKIT